MGLIRYILGSEGRRNLKKLDKMADKVLSLEEKYVSLTDEELKNQTNVLKDRLAKGETLDDILYDAFAVVREAAGRVLNMKHYKVQIIGGICLHQGRVAEMKTGEGKTLVATLPAYLYKSFLQAYHRFRNTMNCSSGCSLPETVQNVFQSWFFRHALERSRL